MAQSQGNVRQRQAEETRLHLLTAACEVFNERGFQSTSVGAITARANTAHGTFYLYFKNKEDAFCQAMELAIADLAGSAKAPDPNASLREQIEVLIRGFFAAYVPRTGMWRAVLEASLVSPRVQTIWLQLRRAIVDVLIARLRDGQADGTIRDLDPVLTGYALAALVDWFAFMHVELNEPPVPEDGSIDAAVDMLVDLWLHAVYGQVAD
ncbi:MAG: TetR/AcrR family transcriptional regulator [Acidimicrobiales bacterium]